MRVLTSRMARPPGPAHHRPMRAPAILAALFLATFPALATAAPAGKYAAGRAIARPCAACHAIGVRGASPDPHAPPFRTLARKYPLENLQEGFAEGVFVGHSDGMPMFRLSPEQIQDFLNYLRSIQR